MKDAIKDSEWIKYTLNKIMDSGGMVILLPIPFLILAVAGYYLLKCIKKSCPSKMEAVVEKVKKILFFNIFIRYAMVSYLSLCITTNFGAIF